MPDQNVLGPPGNVKKAVDEIVDCGLWNLANGGPTWINRQSAIGNPHFLVHHQRAFLLLRVGTEAASEEIDNMIVQRLAPSAPAAGAGQLFDTTAQSAEANHARFAPELISQFAAQTGKEK